MANENGAEELDLGEEKPGKSKLIIIIAAVALLLVGGGLAAYFLLSGGDDEQAADESGELVAEEAAAQGPAQYLDLDPPFVVTLPGKPSLLQVGVSVRFSNEALGEFVTHNDPMIRHNLLNLLSAVDAKALKDRSEKEALQKKMLNELNRVLKELNAPAQIDALYFTSFVTQ
ncbi:MAG: flagellar basal body-associated FliL family protein [Candidatus Thiodiazotropha sp. (ex Monitilora ramsayi)]|nr:flagellar basal body-associated FliL family protein [Candidatus Thiodiazotropha sp. (ex Monitilora ramsayi)]